VVVAPVLLSVTVIVHAAEPVVRVAVAEVFDTIVGVVRLSPEHPPPLKLNRELAVSEFHNVFAPVRVKLGVVLVFPELGEIESVAVAIVTGLVTESVVSAMVQVPVLPPVVTVTV
jgi:hypothetical protein